MTGVYFSPQSCRIKPARDHSPSKVGKAMKHFFLIALLITACFNARAVPQESRPPLSKDEVIDLLISNTPSKIIVSTIKQYGIAFKPTDPVLNDLRKAGADKAVLAAIREAWHADVPKPLGDREIRIMLAGDVPGENIIRIVLERGIDFQPTPAYLQELRNDGAKDALIDVLRAAGPRPFSKDELVQQLTARVDQKWLAQKVRDRAIDFEPTGINLTTLRNAGAQPPLLESIRTSRRAKPFVAQAGPAPRSSPPLVGGRAATLICEPSDHDVPVFAGANDLGNVVARLRCGEHVTFMEKAVSPPGIDKIKYGDGKEGFVANSFLEFTVATPGGDVTAPVATYRPGAGYTPEARREKIEGTVKLSIVVDTLGNVADVQETSAPLGFGLDKNAIDAVKKWKFNPATRAGDPVSVRVMVEVSFRLQFKTP